MTYKFIDGNIEIFKRDDSTIPLSFNVDLTGSTIYLSAKTALADTTYVVQVTNSTHDDPVNGISHITIPSASSNITAGSYFVDIVLSSSTLGRNTIFPSIENETAYLIILDHPKED